MLTNINKPASHTMASGYIVLLLKMIREIYSAWTHFTGCTLSTISGV